MRRWAVSSAVRARRRGCRSSHKRPATAGARMRPFIRRVAVLAEQSPHLGICPPAPSSVLAELLVQLRNFRGCFQFVFAEQPVRLGNSPRCNLRPHPVTGSMQSRRRGPISQPFVASLFSPRPRRTSECLTYSGARTLPAEKRRDCSWGFCSIDDSIGALLAIEAPEPWRLPGKLYRNHVVQELTPLHLALCNDRNRRRRRRAGSA